jgi:hypothetical protein
MTTKAKFLEVAIDQEAQTVSATFGNGARNVIALSELPQDIIHAAALLGLSNKVRDTAANFSKDLNYADAHDAMCETIDALIAGTWNRNGGGVAGTRMKDLAMAIAELKKVDFERAMKVVKEATKEQRAAWVKNAAIAALMAGFEMERMKAKAATATDEDGLPTFDIEA